MGCCANTTSGRSVNLKRPMNISDWKEEDLDKETLALLIKVQCRFRGLLIRKKIKEQYGFEFSGIRRIKNLDSLTPEQLNA